MEKYAVLSAVCRGSFWERLCHLYMKTGDYIDMENLENRHVIYVRVFLSDICNQYAALLESQLWQDYLSQVPCSVIGQAPLDGSKISLLVCTSDFVDNPSLCRVRLSEDDVEGKDVYGQAVVLFDKFVRHVRHAGNVAGNVGIRVWIYLADVADSIADVEQARDYVFERYGVNLDEWCVAVTCIEGVTHVEGAVIALDYIAFCRPAVVPFCIAGIEKQCGKNFLTCAEGFGLTFDNNLRVDLPAYAFSVDGDSDLSQLDVRQFTGILLGDVGVKLKRYGVTMNDVRCFVVYLRDFSDYPDVDRLLSMAFPNTPHVIVRACGADTRQPVLMGCVAIKPICK